MAYARIRHHWADGSVDVLEVGSKDAGYPQVFHELIARVLDLYREVCVGVDDEPDVETGG